MTNRNLDSITLERLDELVSGLSIGFGKDQEGIEELLGSIGYQMSRGYEDGNIFVDLDINDFLKDLSHLAMRAKNPVSFLRAFDKFYDALSENMSVPEQKQRLGRVFTELDGPMVSTYGVIIPSYQRINLETEKLIDLFSRYSNPSFKEQDSSVVHSRRFAKRSEGQGAKMRELATDPSNS